MATSTTSYVTSKLFSEKEKIRGKLTCIVTLAEEDKGQKKRR